MAMRSVVSRASLNRLMAARSPASLRCFSDGRVFSEEERAAENIYIKKKERERQEKAKLKAEKEKAEKEKADQKGEDSTKG